MPGRTQSSRTKIARLVAAINERPHTSAELESLLFCRRSAVWKILNMLRVNNAAHISGHVKTNDRWAPQYSSGAGVDARLPKPLTRKQIERTYRKRLKADPERDMMARKRKAAGRMRIRREPIISALFGAALPGAQA